MNKGPDRLYVEKSYQPFYKQLEDDDAFGAKDMSNKEKFLCAMAIGVRSGVRVPLKGAKDGIFHDKDLHEDGEALLFAVAVQETKSAQVLADKASVYLIAEEYANSGIRLLKDRIEGAAYGTFLKSYEEELVELCRAFETASMLDGAE